MTKENNQAKESLKNLKALIKKEREAEINEYKNYVKNTPLTQRSQKGYSWYPLKILEKGYGMGDYPFLIVERTTNKEVQHVFNSGNQVELFSNKAEEDPLYTSGVVNYVKDNTMKVILHEDDFPEWINQGKLGINLLYDQITFQEMEKALNEALNAENNRLAQLREALYKPVQNNNISFPSLSISSLNESQGQAVAGILNTGDYWVVHGPPGTGKTTTLVQAIKQLTKQNEKILVCAPGNIAVDFITQKLLEENISTVRIGNLSRIGESILEHTLEGKLKKHERNSEIKKLKRQAGEYREMALKYKRNYGKAERDQRKELIKESKNIAKDALKIEDQIVTEILDNTSVITSTLVGSRDKYLQNLNFNTLIIDEAAQALEPACWIPLKKAEKVIFAGDPFQLPPTVKSKEAAEQGLNKTLIEKLTDKGDQLTMLNIQYRMNENIMGFSNKYFYNEQLRAHQSVASHTIDNKADHSAITFIDTAGCGFEEMQNPETLSIYNPEEVQILEKHLQYLSKNNTGPIDSIGIISPYKEQVKYMKKNIYPELISRENINTIDAFQGQERDIIYITLVRSNEKGITGFLSDYRRMNVALTRARKKLIVIGDSSTLGSHTFYENFIEYCSAINAYQSAFEWIYD